MSLSRAFTTRRSAKANADASADIPKRSITTKHSFSGTIRHKISAPIELISTTNMLSYNAPDIFPSNSSSASSHSGDESGHDSTFSSPLTSPDTSSIESSSPTSPEPNHLSCYFGVPSRQSASDSEAPVVPKRAVSHTKSASLQRSASRMSSRKPSTSTARSSINMFTANVDTIEQHQQHPFGNELAQVSELAEEYGISKEKLAVVDEEEQELISKGLFKFRAEDYMSEIQGLFMSAFGDTRPTMSSMWI
ncbi:uncharacterized protein PAC_00688 [Phialocephala subalpina]|uniref:Uncharacterized protein n=1 Tax=Phialocephala subalpina TaxID=576137 RepID=A0A1L7WDE9_9HELO|nr:uncharacterized protein PAC_00688 [Phialocephala subalpina]